jgi:hypothetical protein
VVGNQNAVRTIFGLKSRDSALETMRNFHLLPLTLIISQQSCKLVRRLALYLRSLFPDHFNSTAQRCSRHADAHSFFVPGPARQVRALSLFYDGVRMYNDLPQELRALQTQRRFMSRLRNWGTERLQLLQTTAAVALTKR